MPSDATTRTRFAAQLLHPPGPATVEAAVHHLLAVQAQDLRAARLALRARTASATAAAVDRGLTDDRSLVVAWLNRGTLHLVHAEDHAWLLALTAPPRMAASRRRLGQEGVTPDDADRAVAIVERALADEGPLTRPQLAERIAAHGIRTEGQATPHLLALTALRGVAVLGPVREDGAQAFALIRDWLGAPPAPVARERALAELARRYLAAHGPATAADLAAWAGLPLRDARAGMAAIARHVRAPEPGPAPLAARLLPAFDPYLLGWHDRAFAVAPEHARRVHPGGGVLRAVALVEGRAAGTWSARRHGDTLRIEIDPFAPLGRGTTAALEAEAADVARFEGRTLA